MQYPTRFLAFLFVFLVFNGQNSLATNVDVNETTKVYIVYLGNKPHDDHERITDSHHDMLSSVVGSKEEAKNMMIYSYRYSFSGFAAKLTKSQANEIAKLPSVVKVLPNRIHSLQTSRSWDYLGLSLPKENKIFAINNNNYNSNNNNNNNHHLLEKSKMGDGIIIGIIDSGIWANSSKSFSDEGLGPIPARWRGACKSESQFDATKQCNKKVIGARWFGDALMHDGKPDLSAVNDGEEDMSPLDFTGHGTHVAGTAAGSVVNNVTYDGLNFGTIRGGAPRARLAIYKACWGGGISCSQADVLQAFDTAVNDGVDVINLSLGSAVPIVAELYEDFSIGSYHAVSRGVTVVGAAGNDGPVYGSITNTAPWLLTVAATTVDRAFPTRITLGNNRTIMGEALYGHGAGTGSQKLAALDRSFSGGNDIGQTINDTQINGSFILCFLKKEDTDRGAILGSLKDAGAKGVIFAKPTDDILLGSGADNKHPGFPVVEVGFESGTEIFNYVGESEGKHIPAVTLSRTEIRTGKPLIGRIATFSSRGPNSLASAVLKPDIAAPGANILAASSPKTGETDYGYQLMSGTSMAAPHVTALVALLKALHPDWSPAAMKSALVTTALNKDSSRSPIFADGSSSKLADAFDYGGGIVNVKAIADPGLVYDMKVESYINYMCDRGFNNRLIYDTIKEKGNDTEHNICPAKIPSILDLNLPSFTIPNLSQKTVVRRAVTNVGPVKSEYKAVIRAPAGTGVSVRPEVLRFDVNNTVAFFEMIVAPKRHQENTAGYAFGSLTWTDGVHHVRSPIAVKTQFA